MKTESKLAGGERREKRQENSDSAREKQIRIEESAIPRPRAFSSSRFDRPPIGRSSWRHASRIRRRFVSPSSSSTEARTTAAAQRQCSP